MKSLLAAALCILASPSLLTAASPAREWTSKDGSAKLTASFHKIEGGKVILLLPNGRAMPIARSNLSEADLAWIEESSGANTGTTPEAEEPPPIAAALEGNLIGADGKPADIKKEGGYPQTYLFYYSASWCGPCVAFTPEVVRFAKRLRDEPFTVVLVPSDRSLEDEIAYLKNHNMPWPGLKWKETGYRGVPQNPGNSIPAAVLTDGQGKILLTTKDTESRGDFLEQARRIVLAKSAPSQAAPQP